VEQGIAKALGAVARGSSLQAAARDTSVPYASLHKAWKALEGDTNGPAWQAFVTALPPLPAAAPTAAAPTAAPVRESPLGPRLKRKAVRYGDAVPYGAHGLWGMVREGVKELTPKIAAGKLTPDEAHDLLEAEGVHVSANVLAKKAKLAPGASPVKTGPGGKLDYDLKKQVHDEITVLRAHDLPVTKEMVKVMVLSKLTDEEQQKLFPKGVTNRVYYGFLDDFDLNTEETKPLESARDLWLTSKVCREPNPNIFRATHILPRLASPPDPDRARARVVRARTQNAAMQYQIWADLAVKNGMAVRNPFFKEEEPYSEVIIWTPEGLDRLVSMDETDVRTDQSKRGKSQATRSVTVNKPGSRRGHSKGKRGAPSKNAAKTAHRGGRASGSKRAGGKDGLAPGQLDRGDALATKSSSKISFAGGTLGNRKALSPHIMANHPLTTEELDSAPVGTARDADGLNIPATFNVNTSGGMLEDDMLMWLEQIAAPAARPTPQARGILCLDGLGQHHTFKVVQKSDSLNFDIALRFPHGSSRGQHEDFEHFAYFRPAHEDAKIAAQVRQFQAARAKAAKEGREPSRAELVAAATLTDAQSLAAAKEPWMEAFKEERVKNGWANEGVVPFTRKLFWDLKKEEEAMGIKPSNVPPVDLSGFNVPTPTAAHAAPSTALVAAGAAGVVAAPCAAPASAAWDEGIDVEVERLLRAEVGDPNLGVPPVPPPKAQPKLGSSLLFKLPGGVTGELGKKLVRAKEVERRLNIARKKYREEKRGGRDALRADNDWSVAAAALKELEASAFELKGLKLPQLQSLVRVLKVGKGNGTKGASILLLQAKFGDITKAQFKALCTTVHRGVAQVDLAMAAPERLALPQAPPQLAGAPPAPAEDSSAPLALRKPRRGAVA
jgi:hypothetical protein